jgi:hypothetical protein
VVLGGGGGIQPVVIGQADPIHHWDIQDSSGRLLPTGGHERHPAHFDPSRPLLASTAQIAHLFQPVGPAQLLIQADHAGEVRHMLGLGQ